MQCDRRPLILLAALLLAAAGGCSSLGGDTVAASKPNDRWWRDNRRRAEFVPGKGFVVDGQEGFVDQKGRSMDGSSPAGRRAPGVQPASFAGETAAADAPQAASDADVPQGKSWTDALNPLATYRNVKESLAVKPDADKSRELFEQAEGHFRKKKYGKAAALYAQAAKLAPETALEDDALFMEAECYFFTDRYPKADDSYNALVKKHASSRHLDQVIARQFAIAQYWEKHHQSHPHWSTTPNLLDKTRHTFDTAGHAIRAYENIRLNDPTGPLADDAVMATANAHFAMGHWEDADYHYDLLRKEYPNSEHQFNAHLLGLQCKLRKYQGPDYDGSPLVEADKLIEQLLKQFPDEIGKHRDEVEKIRHQVTAAHAQRDYRIAEYYAGRHAYGAAKFYYRQLARKYPETSLAKDAQARLEKYKDKPNSTALNFAWLDYIFPDGRKDFPVAMEDKPAETKTADDPQDVLR